MSDYISKDDLYWHFVNKGQKSTRYRLGETWELNAEEIRDVIAELPAADVEEVIRCKDCKHRPFDGETRKALELNFRMKSVRVNVAMVGIIGDRIMSGFAVMRGEGRTIKLKEYNFDSRRTYCIGCNGGWICFGSGKSVLDELETSGKLGGCRLGKSDPTPFPDREIKDVCERSDGTIAIIIDGPEVGKFWTMDEYKQFKGEHVAKSETKFTDSEAVAIMIQTTKAAVKDYRDAREALKKCRGEKSCTSRCAYRRNRPKNCRDTIKEVKEFFSGALFGAAFPGVDADYMLNMLEEDELEKSESVPV